MATFVRFLSGGALMCAALSAFAADSGAFLVQDGRSASVIVLPAQPNAVERYAAQELSEHLAKATGATVPVKNENALDGAAAATRIYLGNTQTAHRAGLNGGPRQRSRNASRPGASSSPCGATSRKRSARWRANNVFNHNLEILGDYTAATAKK